MPTRTDPADDPVTMLDCLNLSCPEPILRTRAALREIPVGARIQVLATDPGFAPDVEAFTTRTGHELVELDAGPALISVVLRRLH